MDSQRQTVRIATPGPVKDADKRKRKRPHFKGQGKGKTLINIMLFLK